LFLKTLGKIVRLHNKKEVKVSNKKVYLFFIFLTCIVIFTAKPVYCQTLDLVSPNEEEYGAFGRSVSRVADVTGDAIPDVIVGAPGESPDGSPEDAGRAYIMSGADGALVFELSSPNEEEYGYFGSSVSVAGDVNGDAIPDVIVGADYENPGSSPLNAGRAYIFSGKDGSLLFQLTSPNEEVHGYFGISVSGIGDVNNDGRSDVIVGACYENPGSSPLDAGRAYIFSGKDGSLLFQLTSPNEEEYGYFGYSVSGIGDVNNDGRADVIVGADDSPNTSPKDAGRAYIFSGADGALLFELSSPNEQEFGYFGTSVSGAGDINNDGRADVIVGAPFESPDGSPEDAGRAYIMSGEDGGVLFQLSSPNENEVEWERFGSSISEAGDVNMDAINDVIVGSEPGFSPEDPGRAYIFSGKDGNLLFQLTSPNEEEYGDFAISVSGAGDINNDGRADVIVGAPFESPDGSPEDAGRAYIFPTPDFTPPYTMRIISDDTWKSYDSLQSEWETVDFDDSQWRNAYVPYPHAPNNPTTYWIPNTKALYMWDWHASGTPTGLNGPNDAWFRKTFTLSVAPSEVRTATAIVAADDDFDLYVNGDLVYSNWDGTAGSKSFIVNIKSHLLQGKNVIALYTKDTAGGYEWALIEVTISIPQNNIVSNESWKCYDSLHSGWETVAFDDSLWRNAYAPYPHAPGNPPSDWIPDTTAIYMWDWPNGGIPLGYNGPLDVWCRKTFILPNKLPDAMNATAVVAVDDDFDFYVNGNLAYEDWDGTVGTAPFTIDIRPYLVQGKNVLALYGHDAAVYEWALIDVKMLIPESIGNVNSDSEINIIDALLIARYSADLSVPFTFALSFADTDCNVSANIIDALLTARYSASLSMDGTQWCGPPQQ
jgi:hypothetical protein